MGAVSRMATKCRKCPGRDKWNHKRIEACSYYDEMSLATTRKDLTQMAAAPILRETMQISIGGVMTTVYKEDIKKELYKSLYEHLCVGLNYGV